MPSIDSQTTRLPRATARFFQVSVNGFQLIARSGVDRAASSGCARLVELAGDGDRDRDRAGQHRPAALDRDDEPADDRAEQDRDERPHLDQAVAADQLLGLQRAAAGSRT